MSLPPSISQLTAAASLKLSHNCLQDSGLPWALICSSLSSCLCTLQLGHNQLQQLPACVGQLTALTSLGLENNQLQHIEAGALQGLTRLEVLQLQHNQLQQLPQGLGESCGSVAAAGCYLWQCCKVVLQFWHHSARVTAAA
jgi:Leucine-rich repeat (LRR) protein